MIWNIQPSKRTKGAYTIKTTKYGPKHGRQPAGWGLSAWNAHGAKRNSHSSRVAVHAGNYWLMDWYICPSKRTRGTYTIKTSGVHSRTSARQPAGWGLAAWQLHGGKRNGASSWVYVHSGNHWLMDWVLQYKVEHLLKGNRRHRRGGERMAKMRVRKARAQERGAKHRVKKIKKELGAKKYRKKFMSERKIKARKAKARRKMFERKAKGHVRRIEKNVKAKKRATKKKKPRMMDGGRGRWMERRMKKRVIKIKKLPGKKKKMLERNWKRAKIKARAHERSAKERSAKKRSAKSSRGASRFKKPIKASWRRFLKYAKLLNNKRVMRRVKALVAYAIAARPKGQDMQRQLSRSRSVIVNLIWQLGNHWKPGTNPAFQYLRAFQRAAKTAPFGFGTYLLDDMNRAVIRGKKSLFSYTTGKRGVTMIGLSRSAIGLTGTPRFIARLRVPSRTYQKALLTVHKKGFKFSKVIKCLRKGGKKACKGVAGKNSKWQENKNKVAMYWVSKYRRKFKRAGF